MRQASQTQNPRISAKRSAQNGTELSNRGNMKKFLKWERDSRCNRVLKDRRASQKEKNGTMRFYFEPEPFTGMTDMMSVQSVGVWGDNYFVIEAESEAEATAKLLNLLEKRVLDGRIRPATEEESKKFEEEQYQAYRDSESAARIARNFQRDIQQRESEK
jgi:hypothetical protein